MSHPNPPKLPFCDPQIWALWYETSMDFLGSSPNPLWWLEENICKQMCHSHANIIFVVFHTHMTSISPHLILDLTSGMSDGFLPSFSKYTHLLNLSFSASCSLSGLCHIVHCLIGVSFTFFYKILQYCNFVTAGY